MVRGLSSGIFLLVLCISASLCALSDDELVSFCAISLTDESYQELMDRGPSHHVIRENDGYGYVGASTYLELGDSWGAWQMFDSSCSFYEGETVWLVPMTPDEMDAFPTIQAEFQGLFGDTCFEYVCTHWIVPEAILLAFPAVNTPTDLHIRCSGLDY